MEHNNEHQWLPEDYMKALKNFITHVVRQSLNLVISHFHMFNST